jgi:hypothetical protein
LTASPARHIVVLEEGLGSSDLDTGALDKCQCARLLDTNGDTFIAKVHRHDTRNEGGQCFDSLEGSLVDFL